MLRIIHIAFLDGFLLRSARVSLLSQFELVQVKSGAWSVRCRRLGETFHPVVGPLVEAESLYIHQLQLPRKIRASSEIFVVWDVGLGSAGNVIALLRNTQNLEQGLRIISFDHSREPLRFAMQNLQRLDFLQCYEKALATLLENGSVKFKNGIQPVVWELIESDFPSLLESSNSNLWPKPSAIIYDAFSPARNPTMWTLPVFSRMPLATP